MALSRRLLAAAGVALLAAALYWPTRQHAFLVYDDDIYVTASPGVALGWSGEGLRWAFTTVQGANWFPLTRLSWMLDYELGALDPAVFHTTNLLLHALASGLFFLALLRMTGVPGRSAFAAAVFAAHPLHVESVAWAAARKDPLSGLFFMAALWVWAGCGRGRATPARVAGASLCLALGLFAKQTLVTLPFVLLLLDYWPLGRLARTDGGVAPAPRALLGALLEKWPLFAVAAAMSAVAVLAQRSAGAVADLANVPLGLRLGNACVSLVRYVSKAFVPVDLAVFYPHPGSSLAGGQVALALLGLGLFTAFALALLRRVPAVPVGWLWFVGMLVPVSGLVQVGAQAMADRYAYLPLAGLAIAVAWGAHAAAEEALPAPWRRRFLAGAAAVCVALLSLLTAQQLRHWRDSEALMRHALAVTERNPVAHTYLAVALHARGDVGGAVGHWRRAVELSPRDLTVINNLAWVLATTPEPAHRDPREALELARRARTLAGDEPAVLDTLAAAQAAARDTEAARGTAERALRLAEERGDAALAAQIAGRLELYRRGRPYVEGPALRATR